MTIAQASPRLVILRCTEVISPDTVTVEPSARSSSSSSWPMVQSLPRRQDVLEAHQRVVGDVEAEHLALVAEQGLLVPVVDVRDRDRHAEAAGVVVEAAEQRVLPDRLVALDVGVLVDGGLVDRDQGAAAVPERVERARLDQRLDHPLVADQRRDLVQEVGEVGEAALLAARRDDRVDDVDADVADRGRARTGCRRRPG